METKKTIRSLKCFLGFHDEVSFHVGGADGKICRACIRSWITKDLHTNKIFTNNEGYTTCPRFGKVKPIHFCYLFCGKYLGENRCSEKTPEPQIDYSYVLWTNRMATFGGHMPY